MDHLDDIQTALKLKKKMEKIVSFFPELGKKGPSGFTNSYVCIWKIKTYQTLFSFYIKKYFNLIRKGIISSEKMRNSGNYNYDYAHSFFGKDF